MLCDRDEHPEAWREILRATKELAAPPCVIVTSRLADDRQWAELLNAGAFDLLAKPFEKSNVIRISSRPGYTGRAGIGPDRYGRRIE